MDKENLKMAVIAGASYALKYRDKNPRATEQEVFQNISDNLHKILRKIEDEGED